MKLAESDLIMASHLRKKLLQSLHAFAPADTPARGSEASHLRGTLKKKPGDDEITTKCLRELHAMLCQLVLCPGVIKANVSLNFVSEPTGFDDDATLDLFFLHGHVECGGTSGDWRETRIRACFRGYAASSAPTLVLVDY